MKKHGFALLAAIALLAPSALFADGFTLNAGLTAWGVDAGAVNDSSIYPAVIPAFNLGYNTKVDSCAFKFGLAAEDALIGYSGLTWGTASQLAAQKTAEFITTGRGEPYAELNTGGLSVHVGIPLYYFTPDSPGPDQNGYRNALKWMYKGIGLQYYSTNASHFIQTNNFVLSNYDSISYKIPLSDGFSIVPALQCDFTFVPAVAVADLKPAVAFNYGPVALNAQLSYYPITDGQGIKVTVNGSTVYNTSVLTVDPRLSLSFDNLGLRGFAVFASSSIPVRTEFTTTKVST